MSNACHKEHVQTVTGLADRSGNHSERKKNSDHDLPVWKCYELQHSNQSTMVPTTSWTLLRRVSPEWD
jgi:hypothetical protein